MKLPNFLKKYFWGDDLSELSLDTHKEYIAKKILTIGDLKAFKWLKANFDLPFLKKVLEAKGIDNKSKNLWRLYFK